MEKVKQIFLDSKGVDNYQRIDPSHPVAWYAGLDTTGCYSLFCITVNKPHNLMSTQIIQVFVGKRQAGDYGITFSLKEKAYLNVFLHFCEDIIESTRRIKDLNKVADIVCGRYIQWQKAFRKYRGELLGFEAIKGLIGELVFLRFKMIPKYGPEKALHGWTGIDYTDRDFTYDDTWYEVKTTVSGGTSVKISSVEQLDVDTEGRLAVVFLDKTSREDSLRVTVNSIVTAITNELDSLVLQEEFRSRLLDFGYYPDEAYDDICFSCHGISMYKVTEQFPCIRKGMIPSAVTVVEYKIALSAIDCFREE